MVTGFITSLTKRSLNAPEVRATGGGGDRAHHVTHEAIIERPPRFVPRGGDTWWFGQSHVLLRGGAVRGGRGVGEFGEIVSPYRRSEGG